MDKWCLLCTFTQLILDRYKEQNVQNSLTSTTKETEKMFPIAFM